MIGSRYVARLPRQRVDLAYEDIGNGEPLVLIMGLGATADAWEPHVRAWSREFRCIAVDNRGTGDSSAPVGPYSTAELAEDYAELIAELRLERVRVVGLSMGGAVAQELALRHPRLVRRMVLVSSWARLDRHAIETFENLAAVRAQARPETFHRLLQLWIWSPGWFSQHAEELARPPTGPLMSQPAFAAQVAACVAHDTLDRLAAIRIPTLITAGTQDLFTPVPYAQGLAAGIPDARLEIFDGLGHTHHWEALDPFNELVEGWLR